MLWYVLLIIQVETSTYFYLYSYDYEFYNISSFYDVFLIVLKVFIACGFHSTFRIYFLDVIAVMIYVTMLERQVTRSKPIETYNLYWYKRFTTLYQYYIIKLPWTLFRKLFITITILLTLYLPNPLLIMSSKTQSYIINRTDSMQYKLKSWERIQIILALLVHCHLLLHFLDLAASLESARVCVVK